MSIRTRIQVGAVGLFSAGVFFTLALTKHPFFGFGALIVVPPTMNMLDKTISKVEKVEKEVEKKVES